MIQINVEGHPVAKGRARTVRLETGASTTYTPAKTQRWEADAKIEARIVMGRRALLSGPLSVGITVNFAVPVSWPAWKREAALDGDLAHTGTPDLDNVVKAATDAMRRVIWIDDSQIVELEAVKGYRETPSVIITASQSHGVRSQITKRSDLMAELERTR